MIIKLLSRSVIFSTIVLIACGCATNVGSVRFPQPSQGFGPRLVYDTDIEKAWQAVNRALDSNRIPVLSADKASGRVQTDYIQGASAIYAGGLGGVGESRYSYNIRIVAEDPSKVRITVLAKLEQTLSGAAGATPYRDLTAQNRPLVTALEDWLYEQIEQRVETLAAESIAPLMPVLAQDDTKLTETLVHNSPWKGTWSNRYLSGEMETVFMQEGEKLNGSVVRATGSPNREVEGQMLSLKVQKGKVTFQRSGSYTIDFELSLNEKGELIGFARGRVRSDIVLKSTKKES